MNISPAGIALIKQFEGCSLKAYCCPAGKLSIGYGYTFDVKPGDTITQDQAEHLLESALEIFVGGVNDALKVPVTQGQFDALVSFAYNCGTAALRRSTLLAKVNAGKPFEAADEFAKWVKCRDTILPGLIARRKAERELFLSTKILKSIKNSTLTFIKGETQT